MPPIDIEPEPDDLRASLEAAIPESEPVTNSASSDGNSSPQTDADAASEQSSPVADAASLSTDPQPRKPDGKFAPKTEAAPDKAAPVADAANKAATEKPSTDPTKASAPPASTPANAPPVGWTADEKALWASVPPAVQAAVSRREQQMEQGGRQWSEEKRRYESVLSPVAQASQRRGMSVDQGLNALLNAQTFLDRDPHGAIRWLAQAHGVDLAALAGQSSANGAATDQTPQHTDIAALVRQAVQPMLAPVQERFARQDQEREMSVTQFVTEFSTSSGHEHWPAVEAEIMDMIPGIKARNPAWTHEKVLQEAYDRAVYANPTTRQAVLGARDTAADEKRRTDAAARATKARSAAVSVTGSPAGQPATAPKDSIRAEIEAAFAGG